MLQCISDMTRKKIRRQVSIYIKTAITIMACFGMILAMSGVWRYFWTYWEIKRNHVEVIEATCVSIAQSKTEEWYQHSWYRYTYDLLLDDGTVVAVYQDVARKEYPSEELFQEKIVTGKPMKFTYMPRAVFENGSYELLSISYSDSGIFGPECIVQEYARRVKSCVLVFAIFFCIAIIFFAIPLVLYVSKKWKRYSQKQAKNKKE